MSIQKKHKKQIKVSKNIKQKINNVIDEIIREAQSEQKFDAFYKKKTEHLCAFGDSFLPVLERRFKKSPPAEQKIILNLLKQITGVEHITFLQNYIKNNSFLPSIGLEILDVCNKSDAILDDGVSAKIIEVNSLYQKIVKSFDSQTAAAAEEYALLGESERVGILQQLADEYGPGMCPFLMSLQQRSKELFDAALHYIASHISIESFRILQELYGRTSSKDVAKIMKKTGHVLKQKGIAVDIPQLEEKNEAVFQKATLPPERAFISSVDAEGFRLIFMMKPLSIHEFKIFHIVTNDLKGIHETEVMTVTRKDANQFIEKIKSDDKIEFLETEPAYGAFLVDEACAVSEQHEHIVSANIDQWRLMFSHMRDAVQKPRIYSCIQEADIIEKSEQLLQSLETFFDETECHYWFVLSEEGKEAVMKLKNIMYSPLVLSDTQKKERINELEAEISASFFTDNLRRAYKRRLEEIAYFLYNSGKTEKAHVAVAAAQSLDDNTTEPENNRFCISMIHKGISFIIKAYQMNQGEKQQEQHTNSSALIV